MTPIAGRQHLGVSALPIYRDDAGKRGGARAFGFAPTRTTVRLALLACGTLNGLTFELDKAVTDYGLAGAIADTFGISVIVWAGLYFAVAFLRQQADAELQPRETYIYLLALAVFMLPLEHVSWAGLSLVALGILSASDAASPAGKGGWILLAVTFPMFWSKLVFSVFSGLILQVDATLASFILGRPRDGNTIALADGHTHLFIAAPCSSMANISLVVLCWTIFCQLGSRRSRGDFVWCLVACGTIVAINVGRISLIGFYPSHYDLLHGAIGASVASWIILIAMASIFKFGMNRGR